MRAISIVPAGKQGKAGFWTEILNHPLVKFTRGRRQACVLLAVGCRKVEHAWSWIPSAIYSMILPSVTRRPLSLWMSEVSFALSAKYMSLKYWLNTRVRTNGVGESKFIIEACRTILLHTPIRILLCPTLMSMKPTHAHAADSSPSMKSRMEVLRSAQFASGKTITSNWRTRATPEGQMW